MHAYIHTHTHTYTHTYILTYVGLIRTSYIRIHTHIHIHTQHTRMYIYACIYVCIHMYIRMYVHMCYVLIHPPIPYITSSRCKRLHKFRPVEILLHKRTNPRVPPCNDLNIFVLIYEVITSYFFYIFLNIKFMMNTYV